MTALVYQDFDLSIEPSSSDSLRYRARVSSLAAGQASGEFTLPFSAQDLEILFLRLGRPRRGVRAIGSPEMGAAQAFGSQLFATVFTGPVQSALISSLSLARQQGQGLRIRLRLSDAPALADLPWEFLYDPAHRHFLAYSTATPLVRYLDLPHTVTPLTVQPPLKVLVMIANPRDHGYSTLDVEEEWRKVRGALSDLETRGLVQVTRLEAATLSALQRQLRRDQYHIFHFVGHGGFDQGSQSGVLLLEDDQGRNRMVSGHYLGAQLRDHFSLRLALLNACEGARTSRFDPFAGVAQHLVQQGIPAVIAMQFEITDKAAITLSHEFYNALADNYGVDAALSEARKALFTAGNDIEWGTPVLYLRAQSGELFDVALQPATPPVTTSLRVDPEPQPASQADTLASIPDPQEIEATEAESPLVEQPLVQQDSKPQLAAQFDTDSAVAPQETAPTEAEPQQQSPPVEQPSTQQDSKSQPATQAATDASSITQQRVSPSAEHVSQREPTLPLKHAHGSHKVAEPAKAPLSAWNPLHYLNLLWWIFITPQQLQAYMTKDGEIDRSRLQPIGGYLTSVLTWLPLLLPTLALGLERLPHNADAWSAATYGWFSLLLISTIPIGGWLYKYKSDRAIYMAMVVVVGMAVGVAISVAGAVEVSVVGVVAVGVAISVVSGVAVGVAISVRDTAAEADAMSYAMAYIVAVSVCRGVARGAVLVVGDVVAGVLAFVVARGVVRSMAGSVQDTVKKGTASWLGYSCFGALVLAYGFLLWYCYLGGYQWFV